MTLKSSASAGRSTSAAWPMAATAASGSGGTPRVASGTWSTPPAALAGHSTPDHRDPSPGGAVSHRVRNAAGEVRFEYVGMCPACRAGDRHEPPTAEENLTKQRGTPDGGA